MKLIHVYKEINNCKDCIYADQTGEQEVICLHKESPESSWLKWEDNGKIPEWCPLLTLDRKP